MFLAPDGDEIEIANAAAEFLADAIPLDRLHGKIVPDISSATRRSLSEMGWFSLALSEEDGGSGLSAVEHTLFFREVGRHCGPVDVLAQCLGVLSASDQTLRTSLMSGEQGVALAVDDGDGLRIFGAAEAQYALYATRSGASLFPLADAGATDRASLDPATSMRSMEWKPNDQASVSADDGIWLFGQLGIAAMLVGIAEATLAQIVEYAKLRETFGRKIGSYQAVRHPCADMAIRAEAARSQLWFAAAAMKEGHPDARVHLDAAKLLANQAAVANADTNIQLHGGIGVTEEHHAHLYLKHALVLSRLFGSKRELLSRLLHAKTGD
jgi:alkylation response protein AidB-like acyl-CoA dehydrogenase